MNPRGADLLKLAFHSQTNGFRAAFFLELATLSMQQQSEISFARISHTSREESGETDLKHCIVQRERERLMPTGVACLDLRLGNR